MILSRKSSTSRTMLHRLLAAVFVLPALAFAQAPDPKPFELGAIIVSAEADEKAVDAIADTLDAGTIRKLERSDLADALKLSPGVTLNNTGPRNEAGVYVRGFDLRQVPLFIDGIPVYVPYDGYVDLRRFTTADVAEIRVNKGFSSSLYGPNTLGGAINVVTRRPDRPFEGDLLGGWFQSGGYQSALNIGLRQGDWYLQLGGSYLNADSYPLSHDYKSNAREGGDRRDNAWREDWRFSAKIGYTPNETDEYALGYVIQRGSKGNPTYTGTDPLNRVRYWQWPSWDKQTVYLITNTRLHDRVTLKTRLYHDQFGNSLFAYDNNNYDSQRNASAFQSYYDDWTFGGSAELTFRLAEKNTLRAALHGKLDHHDEQNDARPDHPTLAVQGPHYVFEDTTWSLALEDTHEFTDRFSTVVGLSYDRRDVLKSVDTNTGASLGGDSFDAFNPQLGLFYKLAERQRLHATVARKSRFPTIKDRYSYRLGQAIPNPDLEPERALHLEVGYEGTPAEHLTLRANLFAAEIDDTIQRVDNVQPGRFQLQNVGRSRHLGTELGFDWKPSESFQFTTNYAYLDRKNESQPSVRLIDTPRHSLLSYADIRPVKWLSIIPSVEYNGSRYSTTYGVEAGAWAVTSLKLSFRLPRDVTLSAGVNNLFDRNYQLAEGFPEAGRSFFVNVQHKF